MLTLADLMVVPAGEVAQTHTALVMGEPVAFYMDGGLVAKVASMDGVRAVSPQIFVESMASSACCTGRLMLVGNHVLGLTGDPRKFYGTGFRFAARLDPRDAVRRHR